MDIKNNSLQSPKRSTILAKWALVPLVLGIVTSSVLVSLAAGRFETVKLAYILQVVTSGATVIMGFLGLHAVSKFWRKVALGSLIAGIIALIYGLRMLSLAYTFQMNLQ